MGVRQLAARSDPRPVLWYGLYGGILWLVAFLMTVAERPLVEAALFGSPVTVLPGIGLVLMPFNWLLFGIFVANKRRRAATWFLAAHYICLPLAVYATVLGLSATVMQGWTTSHAVRVAWQLARAEPVTAALLWVPYVGGQIFAWRDVVRLLRGANDSGT